MRGNRGRPDADARRGRLEGQVLGVALQGGAVVGDGRDERPGEVDDAVGCASGGCRDGVAAIGGRLQLGLGSDQGDDRDVDGVLDGSQHRELGRAHQLAAGRQKWSAAAASDGGARAAHPCGSRSDGPSMRTV